MAGASIGDLYIASMYWAFSTLTTVGYGDISANTSTERFFAMAMMLVGVSWYAYVVSSMTAVMSSFDKKSRARRSKMMAVVSFIRDQELPRELGRRIRRFYAAALATRARRKPSSLDGDDASEIFRGLTEALRGRLHGQATGLALDFDHWRALDGEPWKADDGAAGAAVAAIRARKKLGAGPPTADAVGDRL